MFGQSESKSTIYNIVAFTLTEITVTILIFIILGTISISGLKALSKGDPIAQAADDIRSLIHLAINEAKLENQAVAVILCADSNDPGYLNRLNIAHLEEPPTTTEFLIQPPKSRWYDLPSSVIIDTENVSTEQPNAFSTRITNGKQIAFQQKQNVSGQIQKAIYCFLIDPQGAVLCYNNELGFQKFVNNDCTDGKGCYITFKKEHSTNSSYYASKIYISPLTGTVSALVQGNEKK